MIRYPDQSNLKEKDSLWLSTQGIVCDGKKSRPWELESAINNSNVINTTQLSITDIVLPLGISFDLQSITVVEIKCYDLSI